jgi:hypothetical protein
MNIQLTFLIITFSILFGGCTSSLDPKDENMIIVSSNQNYAIAYEMAINWKKDAKLVRISSTVVDSPQLEYLAATYYSFEVEGVDEIFGVNCSIDQECEAEVIPTEFTYLSAGISPINEKQNFPEMFLDNTEIVGRLSTLRDVELFKSTGKVDLGLSISLRYFSGNTKLTWSAVVLSTSSETIRVEIDPFSGEITYEALQ